jgi:hypothetical protein
MDKPDEVREVPIVYAHQYNAANTVGFAQYNSTRDLWKFEISGTHGLVDKPLNLDPITYNGKIVGFSVERRPAHG